MEDVESGNGIHGCNLNHPHSNLIGMVQFAEFWPTISNSSKISLTASRVAAVADTAHDWRRCFVLYIDFVKALPEIGQFSVEDQIVLAEARFPSFHWALCAYINTKIN